MLEDAKVVIRSH